MLKKSSCLVLALVLLHAPASAKIYQWTDEKGGVVFSSEPPPASATAPPAASADKSRPRSFPLARHGALILSVPESWDQEVRLAPEGQPPTIVLTPRDGDEFEVLITPYWSTKNAPGFNSSVVTKALASEDLKRLLPTAVERDVPIVEIQGKYQAGHYFFLTDRNPGTGYPYMVRAEIGVGDLLLYVTVLCRTKDSEGLRQTLRALQGADHKKG